MPNVSTSESDTFNFHCFCHDVTGRSIQLWHWYTPLMKLRDRYQPRYLHTTQYFHLFYAFRGSHGQAGTVRSFRSDYYFQSIKWGWDVWLVKISILSSNQIRSWDLAPSLSHGTYTALKIIIARTNGSFILIYTHIAVVPTRVVLVKLEKELVKKQHELRVSAYHGDL